MLSGLKNQEEDLLIQCSKLFFLLLVLFFFTLGHAACLSVIVGGGAMARHVCRDTVRLVIRKVQFAPERPGPQPRAEATRQFMMSDEPLHIEASLDKAIYYHGKPISINVHIRNHTMKTVRRIIISVRQYTDICLFNTAQYKCSVASEEADISVGPSSTLCKVFTLTPLLSNNRNKQGLALDGKLKHEDTNLASSTVWQEGANKDMLGILVSYRVKVKALTWRAGVPRGLSVELPFTLMHPKPPVQSPGNLLFRVLYCFCLIHIVAHSCSPTQLHISALHYSLPSFDLGLGLSMYPEPTCLNRVFQAVRQLWSRSGTTRS
uniref:Arrestin, beta 2a n=1 Tax=Eptatretus burgeri TaxID=7764 RepID=A0A8C4R3Y8_EPTBU